MDRAVNAGRLTRESQDPEYEGVRPPYIHFYARLAQMDRATAF